MPYNVSAIFDGAAALLNDRAKTSFTNDAMSEYFKIAYQELRQELEENNVQTVNSTSEIIAVEAGVDNIGGDGGPALPIDMVDPMTLWERTTDTENEFMEMKRFQFLPKSVVQTAWLQYWSFQKGVIKLIGSTSDLDVKIDYVCDPLRNFVNENTQIVVVNTENFLKFRTAALCANFIGENPERAALLDAMAVPAKETMTNIVVKSMQSIFTRRRPFRAGAKSSGYSR